MGAERPQQGMQLAFQARRLQRRPEAAQTKTRCHTFNIPELPRVYAGTIPKRATACEKVCCARAVTRQASCRSKEK